MTDKLTKTTNLPKPTQPFMKLSDLASSQYDLFLGNNKARTSKATIQFHSDKELLSAVEKELDNLGFRKFSLIGEGSYAMAFHTTENQIVRIALRDSDGEEGPRPKHPAILQPIYQKTVACGKGYNKREVYIEVLPQVRTESITDKDIKDLKEVLKLSGYFVRDIGVEGNIGLMDIDGKAIPVLIDAGAIDMVQTYHTGEAHLERWLAPGGSLADKSTWLQTKYESRTAPSNLIDGPTADRIENAMGANEPGHISQTAGALREDGLSKSQFTETYTKARELFEAALDKDTAQPDKPQRESYSFSDAIRDARKITRNKENII